MCERFTCKCERVFPAHAGMSPILETKNLKHDGFPRTRGDEPAHVTMRFSNEVFSPHTRG